MLHDVNYDESRLRARGLGRLANEWTGPVSEPGYNPELETTGAGGGYSEPTVYQGSGSEPTEYTPYEVVTDMPAPVVLPSPTQQPTLPVFNAATGTSSCVGVACTTPATTAPVVAYQSSSPASLPASAVPATVTPLPDAPKSVNWLLLAAAGGLAFVLLSGRATGLGNAPEPTPAPAPVALGRPPRKAPAKRKHLDKLTVS